MSHFTVLVIGENPEELLEPYNENIEAEPHINETKEQVLEEKEKIKKYLRDPHYDFVQWLAQYRYGKLDKMTYEEFVKTYHGEDAMMDEDGNLLTTYNPKSKWDYYQLGGRWQGMLKLRNAGEVIGCKGITPEVGLTVSCENCKYNGNTEECKALQRTGMSKLIYSEGEKPEGIVGTKSWLDGDNIYKEGWADQVRYGDIDWEGMKTEQIETLSKEWDELEHPSKVEAEVDKKLSLLFREDIIKRYGTKEEYLKTAAVFYTFAVITQDGEWHETGKMGWFGCSSETEEEAVTWEKGYWDNFLKGLPGDALLSVFDCHI